MFLEMWGDVARWMSLQIFGTLGFAVAFAVMEPGGATEEGMLTDRPFARPFWGLVGDFDTSAVTDYYPEAGVQVSTYLVWHYVGRLTCLVSRSLRCVQT